MEEFFSNILIFIPIAIFVALRLAAANKKKKASAADRNFAHEIASLAEEPKRRAIEDEDDDEFDAHALVPDDEDEPAPRPATPKPIKASSSASYRSAFDHPALAAMERSLSVRPETVIPQANLPEDAHREASAHAPSVREPAARSTGASPFGESVEKLPPLKKAVIYAELLGAPKYLS